MKPQTIFNKDIKNKRMYITREFAAPIANVCQAWTDSKLLDQWWAPRPFRAETKRMDFREGGQWLYAMVGPDNSRMYAKMDYLKIVKQDYFTCIDGFADENGNDTNELPSMDWTCRFASSPNGTRVEVDVIFKTEADLIKIAELGFQEGFTAAHGNLDELFASHKVLA